MENLPFPKEEEGLAGISWRTAPMDEGATMLLSFTDTEYTLNMMAGDEVAMEMGKGTYEYSGKEVKLNDPNSEEPMVGIIEDDKITFTIEGMTLEFVKE